MSVRVLEPRGPSLIKTVPMSDEFIRGYIGRIAALEMTGSEVKTLNYLKRPVAGKAHAVSSSRSFWDALSRYSGLTVQQLIASHTLIDFASPALRSYPGSSDQSEDRLVKSLNRLGLESGSGRYKKFCTECRDEQIKAHGFSHWIRQHQMPGRVFCRKHSVVLVWSEDADGYLKLPSMVSAKNWVNLDDLSDVATKRLIERYDSASDMIDRSRRPFDVVELKAVLRDLARKSGLNPGTNKQVLAGESQTPEQAYRTQFPHWWRQDFERRSSSKAERSGSSGLTGVINTMTPAGPAVVAYLSLVTAQKVSSNIDLTAWIKLHKPSHRIRNSLWNEEPKSELRCNFSTSLIATAP